MRMSLLLSAFALSWTLVAQDTLHVRPHDRATIVTDPAAGVRSFPARVRFPARTVDLRQVLLTVTFACPDSLRCAEWDYLDHILVHPLGTNDTIEVARMLTPYGGFYRSPWSFTWRVDVTDLSSLLRDSVEVIYVHSGFEPNNDRGWAVTLDFACITGPPAARVLGVHTLHRGHFAYGDTTKPFEQAVPARTVTLGPSAALARLRVQQTGHGMHADDGCAEFCKKWRELRFDGRTVDRRDLWRECGTNPLQPQAGTWIFDRAHWCPGELQQPDIVDVPLQGRARTHTVDLVMEPYVHDSSTARWDIAAYLVELEAPRARHDVALVDILAPSDAPMHRLRNPACGAAIVELRNLGSEPLRSVDIIYGTEGSTLRTHRWTGHLAFNATTSVALPGMVEGTGPSVFVVRLERPNGKADAWPHDNTLRSTFTPVPVYPGPLLAQLLTNNEPGHNALRVTDVDGRVVLERPLGTMDSARIYTDTLRIPDGCYTLALTDTAGDGLEFWYNTKGGRGALRLLDAEGRLLRRFESDHGHGVTHHFRVAANAPAQRDTVPDIGLFPTRTAGPTVLDYFADRAGAVQLRVLDPQGEVVLERDLGVLRQDRVPLDLSALPPERYTALVLRDGVEVFRRRVRVVKE
jgi:hypothetical protein